MNLHGKSTGSSKSPDRDWSEDLARLHCLQALFPDWTGNDLYLLRQIKESIEASIRQQPEVPDTFESFSSMASSLREQAPGPEPASHSFIEVDFTGRTWEPLFAQQEIVSRLKGAAGTDHVFLLIRGLRQALFPQAKYKTRNREEAYLEATRSIDALAHRWSTGSLSSCATSTSSCARAGSP